MTATLEEHAKETALAEPSPTPDGTAQETAGKVTAPEPGDGPAGVLLAAMPPKRGAEERCHPDELFSVCLVPGLGWELVGHESTRELPALHPAEPHRGYEPAGFCFVPDVAWEVIDQKPACELPAWHPGEPRHGYESSGFCTLPGATRITIYRESGNVPDGSKQPGGSAGLQCGPADLDSYCQKEARELIPSPTDPDLTGDGDHSRRSGGYRQPDLLEKQAPAPGAPETAETSIVAPKNENDRRSSWRLLSEHDFRLYFFGTLLSNLGTWLQSTAQVLIAYQVTHSVFTVGLITSAQFAGMIAVSPWAAVLADRFSSRAVLVGTQGISAVIAAWMAWRYLSGELGVHSLVFGALALGIVYSLSLPIQTALVPTLVDEKYAADAVKMNSVSYNAGRALAPALCVLVIATVGPDLIFTLNAISFVLFAIALRRLKQVADDTSLRAVVAIRLNRLRWAAINVFLGVICLVAVRRLRRTLGNVSLLAAFVGLGRPWPTNEISPKRSSARPRARATDGLKIALRNRRILLLLAIVAAVTFADDPIFVLSPALARTGLDTSGAWAGYFIAALGWGSVLGSLPPTSKVADARSASRRAALSLLLLGASVVVFAMGFSTAVSLAAAFVAGGAGLFAGAAAQTALLRHQKKKRATVAGVASVAALWAIAWAGTKPFASIADGWLGSQIGIVPTSVVLVMPAILIAVCELLLPREAKLRLNGCAERLAHRVVPSLDFLPRMRQVTSLDFR